MNQFNLSGIAYVAGLAIIGLGNNSGHFINALSAVSCREHSFQTVASLDRNRLAQDGHGSHFFPGIEQLGYTQENLRSNGYTR